MIRPATRIAPALAVTLLLLAQPSFASDRQGNLDALAAMAERMDALVAEHGYASALAGSCSRRGFERVSQRLPEMLRAAGSSRALHKLGNSGGGSPWRSEKNCRCGRRMVQLIGGDWQQINGFLLGEVSRADREFGIRKTWTMRCKARAGF